MKTSVGWWRRLALCALALSLCATPVAAQRARRSRARRSRAGRTRTHAPKISFAKGTSALDVPFELYANVIFLRASVNGSEPLSFIFDTGAGINVVNAERAANLRLARAGGGVDAKGTGGSVTGSLAVGATVSLPGVSALGQRIAVLPIQSLEPRVGRRVDGILGYDFIRGFVVEIDYERSTISFHDPRSYRYAGRGAVVPLGMRRGTPFVRATIDLTRAASVAGEFEIDTGSDGALGVYDYFAKAHGLRARLPRTTGPQAGAGVGGDTSFVEARVRDFRLGRFRVENPVVSLSEDDNEEAGGRPEYDGMIGTEVFRRFKMIVDYSRRRLILEPNSHFREPYETDMSGVSLSAEGGEFRVFRVTGVKPDSAGARGGLRAGDVITEMDGRPASALTLDEISRAFARDGSEHALTLTRGGEIVRATIKLKRTL